MNHRVRLYKPANQSGACLSIDKPRVIWLSSKLPSVLKRYSYRNIPSSTEIQRLQTFESIFGDYYTMADTDHDLLDPATRPETILHRADEQALLHATVTDPASQHLYIHGPRGVGKTLLICDALTTSTTANTYYVSCVSNDTQYKVLEQLYERVTDAEINPGYHTAQLQQRLVTRLRDDTTIIVLDDLAFLLANDGNDLLYFLSRLDRHAPLCIIGIAAQPSLLTDLDERTYSSLRPRHLAVTPYTEDEVVRILAHRVKAALPPDTVSSAALEHIAATTSNLTLGLYWLSCAADEAAEITVDVLQAVQNEAVHQYRDALLTDFTWHHAVLLEVIEQATADSVSVTTGTVYQQYTDRCRTAGNDPLTVRRISDYLTHLELLNLIDVTHYHGGATGKTREIQPTPLQEL